MHLRTMLLLFTLALLSSAPLFAAGTDSPAIGDIANGLGLTGIGGAILWVGRQLALILQKIINSMDGAVRNLNQLGERLTTTAVSLEHTSETLNDVARRLTSKALLIALLILLPLASACTSPDKQYIHADAATWAALVPDLVDAEGNLRPGVRTLIETTDQLNDQQRADLLLLLEAWRLRLVAWNADPEQGAQE